MTFSAEIRQVDIGPNNFESIVNEAWDLRDNDPIYSRALAEKGLVRANGYPLGKAQCLTVLSFLDFRAVRLDVSLEQALKALKIFGNTSQLWLPRLFNVIALNYALIGERSKHFEFLLKQLEVAQQLKSDVDISTAFHDLGLYYFDEGDHKRAFEHFERARTFTDEDPSGQAFLLANLGSLYIETGQVDKGSEHLEQALSLSREISLIRVEKFVLCFLARLAREQKQFSKALELYEEILAFHEIYKEQSGQLLLEMAEVYLEQHKLAEAVACLGKAYDDLQISNIKLGLADYHKLFYDIYKSQAVYDKALFHYEEMYKLQQLVFNEENEMKIRALDVAHRMDSLRNESELLTQKNEELERSVRELEELHHQMRELSIRDDLTGLYNRRYLFEQANNLIEVSRRYKRHLSVAMLDIDHFKAVNDTFGHKIGDDVLKQVASLLKLGLRNTDPVSRYGGEEFAIIMPEMSIGNAVRACERLRKSINDYDWAVIHPDLKITVSIGVTSDETVAMSEELFSLADAQLYQAKRGGRNQVVYSVN